MKTYERMQVFETFRFYIRVWCAVPDLETNFYNEKVQMHAIVDRHKSTLESARIAEDFAKLSYCNAVEVTDHVTKNGVLIYPDWP